MTILNAFFFELSIYQSEHSDEECKGLIAEVLPAVEEATGVIMLLLLLLGTQLRHYNASEKSIERAKTRRQR